MMEAETSKTLSFTYDERNRESHLTSHLQHPYERIIAVLDCGI